MLEDVRRATEPVSLARLRAAINNDELSLDFQPVVTRTPKHLRMLEALVRWDHPEIGRMLPGGFIPMAEGDAATIDALADWVVGAAVDAYRVLAELGICVPLLVNMSARNLLDLTLPDRIEQTLRNGDMPARDLHIEVTETAAIDDFASTIDVVTRLRLKGIVLWLNNFGTGYSTFKILEQIPFSEIKIDRTFVRGMATSRLSRSIVKSISGLAADLEMTCTAEGVDTEQTAEMLEQMGVASLQGDFIGRPMPVESVHVWMSFWTGKLPSATFDAGTIPMRISTPFPAQIATMQVDPGAADVDTDDVQLPPRQTQVMRLLSEGCSVKEIARQLGLGVGTVKVHLSLAYSALGARNRIEAIRRFGALPPLPV
jgi:EAL domain-containing protein (putative c-di-GMP-specific phosphodiesterase class I)/DNA-binding CsgD family transcriptional regulator